MAPRAPRRADPPGATRSVEGQRLLYDRVQQACTRPHEPDGHVALVLIELWPASASASADERVLAAATTGLAEVLNRRLREVDVLVRSAACELAVLLARAHIGVAVSFSERLRQPIERALHTMGLSREIAVCMGLAANPPAARWHPDALIELADHRVTAARQRHRQTPDREWALVVESAALPSDWADPTAWPATEHL
jgi:GGDEF domain-containing protein